MLLLTNGIGSVSGGRCALNSFDSMIPLCVQFVCSVHPLRCRSYCEQDLCLVHSVQGGIGGGAQRRGYHKSWCGLDSTHFETQAGDSRGGDRWLQGYEHENMQKRQYRLELDIRAEECDILYKLRPCRPCIAIFLLRCHCRCGFTDAGDSKGRNFVPGA